MRFSTAIISTLLGVAATVSAETFTVLVGKDNGLTYDPPTVNAKVGDVISFQFLSKNHTVTQSTFASPCVPKDQGVDSGFQFVPEGAAQIPAWSITINDDSTPLWFFCNRAPHCERGMVFSVNPTADKSHEAFLENARAGGGAPPADGGAGAPPAAPPAAGDASASATGAAPAITLTPAASGNAGAAPGAANAAPNPNSDPSGTAASQQQADDASSAAGAAVKGAGWMAMGVAGVVALLL
ncbi:hypothetical protein CC1G_05441 [Coprinopsis cinerea okayama7|uniref:Phytocyanin domain-containing protein n=1 Tax=Coprinopsis cinerea (strain Okayama-7 / 130 / ATCC MYA-4618 / FGSC 9003) TaxID=240176 RepID=A8NQ46_COPC7|nr:hypothetical protein CC1G_05441 [Coprinopsis cinerea okayama7\|eukprot:XP_001835479.1 hypothetical protein CC1G_05441 [Coprinopsis cinerea okayama7\